MDDSESESRNTRIIKVINKYNDLITELDQLLTQKNNLIESNDGLIGIIDDKLDEFERLNGQFEKLLDKDTSVISGAEGAAVQGPPPSSIRALTSAQEAAKILSGAAAEGGDDPFDSSPEAKAAAAVAKDKLERTQALLKGGSTVKPDLARTQALLEGGSTVKTDLAAFNFNKKLHKYKCVVSKNKKYYFKYTKGKWKRISNKAGYNAEKRRSGN